MEGVRSGQSNKNRQIRFSNDVFFKYCLAGDDEGSRMLRQGIIKELLHIDFRELRVINPEITALSLQGKNIRLDVLLQDIVTKEIINIEMQVSQYHEEEAKRFQYYGTRLIANQISSGNEYEKLVKVYQIIFIDDVFSNGNFINTYQFKNQNNEIEEDNLITRIYVHLPVINRIVKEKGMEGLSDFERVCYLFKNNRNDAILEVTKEGMAKILMEKYEGFPDARVVWSIAQAVEDGETYARTRINRGYRDGKAAGKVETAKKVIQKKYQVEADSWVEGLSEGQIESMLDVIFEEDDFAVFKKKIEKI